MTVYIVLRNGKVDCVFDNLTAARHHMFWLNKQWVVTEILTKEVYSL